MTQARAQLTNVKVTGIALTGATFSFFLVLVPSAFTITSATIDPSGTSATLNLTAGNTHGQFVLVATKVEGSSDSSPTPGKNTLSIVAANRENEYDDSDGFQNGLEVAFGSDPFDPTSVPNPRRFLATEAGGQTFVVGNIIAPPPGVAIAEAVGFTFSILDNVSPSQPPPTSEAGGPTFSVLNSTSPSQPPPTSEAVSQTFSVQNQP